MGSIFMNSEEKKGSDAQKTVLNHMDKMDLRRDDEQAVLSDLSIYQTWKNIQKSYKNNKLKISRAACD